MSLEKIAEMFKHIPKLYETDGQENPIAYLKFQNILGRGTWYVTELSPDHDDVRMFGYVESPLGDDCDEWGYFMLSELIAVGCILPDKKFKPTPIKELIT